MSKEALVQRMLTRRRPGWTATAVRQGTLRDSDFTQLARAAGILQTYPVWIDDTPALTLLEMRSKARRLKIDNDLRLIVVDYLQLMRSPEYAENRVQEISDISRSLKALARELEIPVIALSQLSRASEQRGGERKPILSDLRDSGAIEQDADLVIFIHRPEMYYDREDETQAEGMAEVMWPSTATARPATCSSGSIREYTPVRQHVEPGGAGVRTDARMLVRCPAAHRPPSIMPKPKSVYRCTECGHEHPKWVGRCEACGAWNAVAEEPVLARGSRRSGAAHGAASAARAGRPPGPPARRRHASAGPLAHRAFPSSTSCWAAASCPAR